MGTEPADVFHELPVVGLAATHLQREHIWLTNHYHFESDLVLVLTFKEREREEKSITFSRLNKGSQKQSKKYIYTYSPF